MVDADVRMLVVEHQGELRRTIVAMLKQIGGRIVSGVTNAEEASEYLNNYPVDLIVCEWDLPNMNGTQFLSNLRKDPNTANILFVLISNQGQMSESDYAEASDFALDAHLIKPLNQQDLGETVDDILKKRADFLVPSVHLARAGAFIDIGAEDEANAEIKTAQESKPLMTRFWVEAGELFEELGNDEEARESYKQATEIDKACARGYEGMANILEKEGKSEEAFEMLKKSVEISPNNRDRQFKMTKHLLENGDEDAAQIALHKALENEPDAASRSAAAAEFFLEAGRADLAEAEYSFALEEDPSNAHYYNRLGLAFRRQKKFKEAIDNYRKATVISPDDAVIYFNLAIAIAESGDLTQAIGSLRRALVLRPKFPQAEKILKTLQEKAGQIPAKSK
ncbi:MAG: tetratricopeptide repeat protein [Nitrospinaceae bacterium]|jgi:Tfp pilus assembly protein PilF|nr:tetratricopeptide repeat protein [Nitrospinaceae bacterium]MBT3433024.1 tetratricopeptide repeat protein [Nitrospinaceae bacterium]MBT4093675.1 tetratricopeptide repeat protein [Nitrospinaceae bacterium]MBT4430269.1 tetratricopeptide repeat protein [Nitrospinaceae bacterium]MBT5366949.1 tetratricopeptide repeat protein [Nitrospinaceae bacterium]